MINDNDADIKYLFEPRSIAIVGASHDASKIGYKVVENIVEGGYKGIVYPINPKDGEIVGRQAYASVEEIEGDVDVATLVVPEKYVYKAVESCARKGVKHLCIITSGFSEVGKIKEEQAITELARESGMRIMGPNMFGHYSASVALNATFGPRDIIPGGVAIVTQSGALGIAMMGKTYVEEIGLSAICSVGNKCDLDEADLLEYLIPHEETKVILMYIEGVKGGEKFVEAMKRATSKKPVIVVKSGRSKRGAQAAASHTGSLAGADNVFDAVMKQCGVIRAETIKEAFEWSKFIADNPMPRGDETIIVTNGGGIGVLATDACEKYEVSLYDNSEVLTEIFEPATPEFGSLKNPIDITGEAKASDYLLSLDAAASCDKIHSCIALFCETAVFNAAELPTMVRDTYQKFTEKGKPITFSLFGGENTENAVRTLNSEKIPVYGDVYESVSPLGAVYRYRRYLENCTTDVESVDLDVEAINSIVEKARSQNRFFLLTHEAHEIMRLADVPIPETKIATRLEEAVKHAEDIGYPVVMKVVSKDIIHKSDAGGVAVNLLNEKEVLDAYEAIMRNCRGNVPDAYIEGIEIAEMVKPGVEIIAGAKFDPAFGPIVMVGLGGIYVEVMKDVAFRSFPFDRNEVLSMVEGIRSYPLLLGVRGEERKDIDSLVDTIIKLGSIVDKCRMVSDIEINPVVVYENGHGSKAVDTRILLSRD